MSEGVGSELLMCLFSLWDCGACCKVLVDLLLGVGVLVELIARCWCELSAPSVLSCPPKEQGCCALLLVRLCHPG